ncbi:MAG: hypothetical protein QM809_04685 [Gordonia sp. (in: high G+C Gram-positive bacteria)]|uniref:hypothetical protein n=1 Tax=Gordonia sp. (in: high G+C Gram-positive bacteria) TaxID=84139 RepID=UPI0039E3E24D
MVIENYRRILAAVARKWDRVGLVPAEALEAVGPTVNEVVWQGADLLPALECQPLRLLARILPAPSEQDLPHHRLRLRGDPRN